MNFLKAGTFFSIPESFRDFLKLFFGYSEGAKGASASLSINMVRGECREYTVKL